MKNRKTTKPIQLSPDQHARLVESALRRGFRVGRGPGSKLGEATAELVEIEQEVRKYLTADDPEEKAAAYTRLLELLERK